MEPLKVWNKICLIYSMTTIITAMKLKKRCLAPVALLILGGLIGLTAQERKAEQVALEEQAVRTLPTVSQDAFNIGEKLTYRLHYGFVDAGEATVEVKATDYTRLGRDMYHVVGKGKSLGAFNWFFKVNDRYESYVDQQSLVPWRFVRRVEEGKFKKSQDYVFYQHKSAVETDDGATYAIPDGTQDMISSFYFARSLDFSQAKEGDTYVIKTFMDDELFDLKIKYLGKETIKLRKGKFRCMKFVPVVQEGRIFKDSEDLQVWITDDENKIPILAKAEVLVGSIKMELTDYEGLAHDISMVD
jgi:hypothetical protein